MAMMGVTVSAGSACQNNPRVQRAAVELGALPVLIRLVSLDASVEVRARALYAVSAVVRHFPAAQKALIGHGGTHPPQS